MAVSRQKSNLGFISAGEPFQLELGECLRIRKVLKNFQGTTPLRFNIDTKMFFLEGVTSSKQSFGCLFVSFRGCHVDLSFEKTTSIICSWEGEGLATRLLVKCVPPLPTSSLARFAGFANQRLFVRLLALHPWNCQKVKKVIQHHNQQLIPSFSQILAETLGGSPRGKDPKT